MRRRSRLIQACIVLLVTGLVMLAGGSARAAGPVAEGPIDVAEIAGWLDPLVEAGMAEAGAPGAVFVLVRDGQVVYNRGGCGTLPTRLRRRRGGQPGC